MKNNKTKNKKKFALLPLIAAIPMASTGIVAVSADMLHAQAATSTVSYQKSYVQEVSLSNGNFNSTSSSTLISSPTGWAKQVSDRKSTAGVINTGSSFQRYMTSSYYLSKNPSKDGADSQILMINSKTSTSGDESLSREGFRSNSVSLAANSYYSFKVAFKSSTNFESVTDYVVAGWIEADEEVPISKDVFKAKAFKVNEDGEIQDEYISFTYHNRSYYLLKTLDKDSARILTAESDAGFQDVEIFYEDSNFVGFVFDDGDTKTPLYVSKKEITDPTENDDKVNINNGATAYVCKDITYVPEDGRFKIDVGEDGITEYYNSKTTQKPLDAEARGSIYLDGLKDENGKAADSNFVDLSSGQWRTFNFFVATGDQSQEVNLELWLGRKDNQGKSSGAVFFDNVRINQHSENNFWKAYQESRDLGYDSVFDNGDVAHQDCTKLFDFRTSKEIDAKTLTVKSANSGVEEEAMDYNFDFEEGIYHDVPTTLKYWEKDKGSFGNASILDANNALDFKAATGYDFVGNDLSYDVKLEETNDGLKVVATPNNYFLALWTNNNHVKVTSQEIKIESQKIYKISATYKASSISSGNAYMFVKENDTLVKKYVDNGFYALADEASSGSLSTSTSNNFTNGFSTVEFFVKGGTFLDSSISVSFGLGKSDETSTGCIVFDNVKVESATPEEYANASNKLQLGASSSTTPTVTNGDFTLVDVKDDEDGMYTPQNWTLTKGKGTLFSGVISTTTEKFDEYKKKFEDYKNAHPESADSNNPYYWTTYQKPGNPLDYDYPSNVLMLGNVSKSWQSLKSETFEISANPKYGSTNTVHKFSFKYKSAASDENGFKVSLWTENGVKLFEETGLVSSTWKEFSVYFKSFYAATKVYVQIDLGTESETSTGAIYLSNFDLQNEDVPQAGVHNVVDMTNFGLNLPTFAIQSDPYSQNIALNEDGSAPFKGTQTSNPNGGIVRGGIVKGSYFQNGGLYYVKDAQNKEFFYFSVSGPGAYAIDSNFSFDLESESYYVLSFKAKSYFNHLNSDVSLDKDKEYDYGFTIGLTGFDYMSKVISNEDFQEYKLFINTSDAKTAQLHMALICDSPETSGSLTIYDLDFDKATADEFEQAQEATKDSNFDVNSSKVFAAESSETTSENQPEEQPEEESSTGNEGFNWLLIPTLITALAIVIAVVGYFLRKMKLKKIEIKRKNSYDRKTSANVDLIKRKAAAERDEELKALQTSKAKFDAELEKLETAHKAKIVELRAKDKDSVSKETDKEFKLFAKKRTVIAEKIEVLDKQIEETNSAEHLLSLERKIYAEQEAERRKLQKTQKKNKQEPEAAEEKQEKPNKKKK